MPEILVRQDGAIARVLISHPQRHNALTNEMMPALSLPLPAAVSR